MIETAPVFHATEEDMQDSFGDFVEAIDARLSGPGICKSAHSVPALHASSVVSAAAAHAYQVVTHCHLQSAACLQLCAPLA